MAIREDNKKVQDNMDYKSDKDKMQEENKEQVAQIPKDLTVTDAIKTFKMSLDRDPKNIQEVIDFFKNRKLNKKLPEKVETIV
jgi:hypothetical protein